MFEHLAAATMAPMPCIQEQRFYGILVQRHETIAVLQATQGQQNTSARAATRSGARRPA